MFLHFGVATAFIVLGIWTYSNASLNRPFGFQGALLVFSVVFWFVLYAFGRLGKRKGKSQMKALYLFMIDILDTIDKQIVDTKPENLPGE